MATIKVYIAGGCGKGKTTLAIELAALLEKHGIANTSFDDDFNTEHGPAGDWVMKLQQMRLQALKDNDLKVEIHTVQLSRHGEEHVLDDLRKGKI